MCGRFTLRTPASQVAEAFGVLPFPDLRPRYNIAPSQPVAVVRQAQNDGRELALLKWGLVPSGMGCLTDFLRTVKLLGQIPAISPGLRLVESFRRLQLGPTLRPCSDYPALVKLPQAICDDGFPIRGR
jgi:hypothetical protein